MVMSFLEMDVAMLVFMRLFVGMEFVREENFVMILVVIVVVALLVVGMELWIFY